MHADQGQHEQGLGHEVAIGHRIQRVLEHGGEAQVQRHPGGIQGQGRAGQRAGTQRGHVQAPPAVPQAIHVAGQGPAVGQEMVGQQHGLGPLEMGVAGQVGVTGLVGPVHQHLLEGEHVAGGDQQLALGEQAQVGGHLVVATASGVQLGPGRTGDLGDPALDHGVDVLVGRDEPKLPSPSSAPTWSRAANTASASTRLSTPARTRPRTWARDPVRSSAASTWS